MSVLSVVKGWLAGSPGDPSYAQPFVNATLGHEFASAGSGGQVRSSAGVVLGATSSLRAPANGTLRFVPASAFNEPFRSVWPDFRQLDGTPLDPVIGGLLFEIWPTAFRRLEGMYSTVEGPLPGSKATLPQSPLPRWFVFGGIPKAELTTRVGAIAAKPFPPTTTIDLAPFFEGKMPIFAPVNSVLSGAAGSVEAWTFDSSGLAIDPAVFCGYVKEMAGDVFSIYAEGDATKADPFVPRHVYVFSDHRGAPWQVWNEPDPPFGPQPPEPPAAGVMFNSAGSIPLPASRVLVYKQGDADWTAKNDKLIGLGVSGDHTRVALHPHGAAGGVLQTFFGEWGFARVRVTDLAEWFPRNDEPHNEFPRYTEGNHVVPLADGESAFREMYRAYRSTYRAETYPTDDAMPPGTPRTAPQIEPAQIYMTNFMLSPDSSLLGRRALLTVPRTQNVEEIETDPLTAAKLIPAASTADQNPQRKWWFVGAAGSLPPGACVELEALSVSESFFADDPRIAGKDRGADLYGITVSAPATMSVFANVDGSFFLPMTYPAGWDRKAELRVVTWKPDEDDSAPLTLETAGKGRRVVHTFGPVTVPEPPSFFVSALGEPWSSSTAFVLSNNGAAGGGLLTIEGGVTAAVTIVVVNQRSGDVVLQTVATTSADVKIALPNFASGDIALVGSLPSGGTDATQCAGFFSVSVTAPALAGGFIPAHPKELIGVLREAIDAGVDVRLLVYRDQMNPAGTAAMPAALNAAINGKRGEAIADPILRETSSHHQKTSFVRSSDGVAALIGGVDHLPSRWAGRTHDTVDPDRPTPVLWHDIHCLIKGKAAWDIYLNFAQRWNLARVDSRVTGEGVSFTAVGDVPALDVANATLTPVNGTHAVQVARTLPPNIDAYASIIDKINGEQRILAAYERTLSRARHFLYIEDQYFWNIDFAKKINDRLRDDDGPRFAIIVLPQELAEFPVLDLALYALRVRAINMLLYGKAHLDPGEDGTLSSKNVSDRVLIVHPVNDQKQPVYVHCKMMIADDLWMSIGSANLNRRSMTYDSELNAASIDFRIRRGGHRTARDFRARLMAEHLGLDDLERPHFEDPRRAFALYQQVLQKPPAWLANRHHLVAFDPKQNHYGLQPAEYNQLFLDAIQLAIDPDGRHVDLSTHLSETLGLIKSLAAAEEAKAGTFGGLGVIRATFTFPAGVTPHHVNVEVTDTAAGTNIQTGPFAPDAPASIGVYDVGKSYTLAATAFDALNAQLASGTANVTATGFVTAVTVLLA